MRTWRAAAHLGAAIPITTGLLIGTRFDPPAVPRPTPALVAHALRQSFTVVPDAEYCRTQLRVSCYGPGQLQRAYDTQPLLAHGIDGRGTTIAFVESFGSPTIAADLRRFDAAFGLPAPPSLSVIHPLGTPPAFDPANPVMVAWAEETSLDVEWAHVMAPGARLLVVETADSEGGGVADLSGIVRAENYVVDHGLADVISQSFADGEATLPGRSSQIDLRSAFVNAARRGVTVLAAAGDRGPIGGRPDGSCCLVAGAVWPSSDPLVTAVGGTALRLDVEGGRLSADRVWNDSSGAGGGGLSRLFARPPFQDGVQEVVGGRRGTPDVSLSAGVDDGAALFYYSFLNPTSPGSWHLGGGTSEATPLFAGVAALADQVAGHPLGLLNDRLYRLASTANSGIDDITQGDNGTTVCAAPCAPGDVAQARLRGYAARPGYDLASGLGTVDAARLVVTLSGR